MTGRSYSIRERINKNFEQTRGLADGVLFEFGPSREQDLLWRDRIVRWQPQVRILFLTRIALWKYRAQLPGFELPKAVQAAQQEFDDALAEKLDRIADRLESKVMSGEDTTETLFEQLERTIRSDSSKSTDALLKARFRALLTVCHITENLTISLNNQLRAFQGPMPTVSDS